MSLNRKQIRYILENKSKLSPEKISEKINAPLDEIINLIEQSNKKYPFYFYIILFSLPIIFFVLLEIGLQIFNYGYDYSMWVNVTDDYLILNPDVAKRYFTSVKSIPSSIEDTFEKEKGENTFRVFVLGGSSAAGYPYMPLGSFSRYIRKRLELTYPKSNIEVVNIALSATNSYTIRDFIPGVLSQKPDLILIYAGHNEYYGALGVGSLESVSSSREMVNLLLFLNKFKTTQFIKDFLQWFSKTVLSSDQQKTTGTLMSRMAQDKSIAYNSETFNAGIEQFEGNLSDIIEMVREENVPIIISTLASNLKDQPPFIIVDDKINPPADIIFNIANKEYEKGNFQKADSLYRLAKDLDGLRFRAPEKINHVIKKLTQKYNVALIDTDSLFAARSLNNIVGKNLMTDHLHPTLQGFQLIGKFFFEKMIQMKFVPKNSSAVISFDLQDSITLENFVMPKLDSTIAEYRIKLLRNDWPFIDPKLKRGYYEVCKPKDGIDTLAVKYLQSEISWGRAQEGAANWFFRIKNLDQFLLHMEALLYQYPIIKENFEKLEEIAMGFLKERDYIRAAKVLHLERKLKPNAYAAKWIGQIELTSGRIESAIKYLEESLRFNPSDLQVKYNLAGAYALNKEYARSKEIIQQVLVKDSNYPGAQGLLNQLNGIK